MASDAHPSGPPPASERLKRLLKGLIPESLFGRFLMNIVAPVIALVLIVGLAYFDRGWGVLTERTSRALVSEINMIIEARQAFGQGAAYDRIVDLAGENLRLQIVFLPGQRLEEEGYAGFSLLAPEIGAAIETYVGRPYYVNTKRKDDLLEINVQLEDGVMRALTPLSRVRSKKNQIFILLMVGASIVLLGIAVVFLRNQIDPILQLADAAEKFGKGRGVPPIMPSGAAEVRRAAEAFRVMRERIARQIDQRTTMLAGVSHDLRTPLTRLKLQLAMLGDGEAIKNLEEDVAEMEAMVEGFLAFARDQAEEETVETDLGQLVHTVAEEARRWGGDVEVGGLKSLWLPIRPKGFKRCLSNIADNAVRHAEHVRIALARTPRHVEIVFDDDGPGIPESEREDVFLPFVRLDHSRNPDTGGTGLGLSIARDVARGHGGDIELFTSPLGGLRVVIRLPV